MLQKTIICDLDGTLCDITERRRFIKDKKNPDWKSFSDPKEIAKDKVNHWCAELLSAIDNAWGEGFTEDAYYIVFVSGRMKKPGVEDVTIKWIQDNVGYKVVSGKDLFMRENGDSRPDTEIKSEIYDKYLKDLDIAFCIDDRQGVVDMWRSKGLICLQCAKGDF